MNDKIDLDYVLDLMHSDFHEGWCIYCGAELAHVGRMERAQPCIDCGKPGLYGSFALVELLTGIPAPKDPD
jgi:hypothetical protein